ncbi:uncharacterized protein LOC112047746 isoform X2 [Bicyclus anynana]|uniref:Uncharacterized protein LOC112047746 isoform X2 n=1 Tax=Bicyclus anynana TaxID=110368 RepID=A0ABM3LIX4_BICAN|nr:uncharacterized protein LOC112047746 isoform X2 [Bicyclus anynana]
MSEAQTTSNQIQVTKIHKLPLILKKNSIKPSSKCGMLFRCLPGTGTSKTVIKEDVIYKSVEGDFLQGKYPGICLINRLDVAKNCSSTVASYKGPNGDVIKLTSDAVVKTIGQANYDQVIASLCCVFNQELKVKGILALLSETIASPSPETKKYCSVVTQTYESSFNHLIREKQRRSRNLGRSQVKPYIVPKESQIVSKKLVIHPATFMKLDNVKVEFEETNTTALPDTRQNIVDNEDNPTRPSNNLFDNKHNPTGPESNIVHLEGNPTGPLKSTCDVEGQIHFTSISKLSNKGSEETRLKLETIKQEHDNECTDDFLSCDENKTNSYDCDAFPELNQFIHEDSIISDVSVSNLSIGSLSIPGIERNAQSILNYIDRHTEFDYLDNNQCASEVTNLKLIMVDGSTVTVKGNPDPFHIATPDILKDLTLDDQKKLMLHQAYLDWKYCLQRNEDNNLPIHIAVLNNDVNLVNRQCLVLKSKNESIDIAASGNLTALQMAVFQDCPECTAVLLAQGADLMVRDDEARTVLHLAAEIGAKHVEAIVEHCYSNARQILKEHCELWKPELENKTDDKLVNYLLIKLSMMYDNQGYTPLMLASKLGNDAAVRLLVYAAPSTVNMAMPTCGNTALYLACAAACTEALNSAL